MKMDVGVRKKRKYEEAFRCVLSRCSSESWSTESGDDGSGDGRSGWKLKLENQVSPPSVSTRSKIDFETNWKKCIICERTYYKGVKHVSQITELKTVDTFSRIARANIEKPLGVKLAARIELGLVRHNAVYHTGCFNEHMYTVSKFESAKLLDPAPVDGYDACFHELVGTYGRRIVENDEIFLLTDLLAQYRKLLAEHSILTPYQSKRLKKRLLQHYGDNIIFDSGDNQRESELVFNKGIPLPAALRKIRDLMKQVEDLEYKLAACEESSKVEAVASQVVAETRSLKSAFNSYQICIDKPSIELVVSSTLAELLAMISPKLDRTLPSILIGNIVTNVLTGHPTDLQVALGVELRDSATTLGILNSFLVTSTYDEVRRFLKSAAVDAAENDVLIEFDCSAGLIETVVDNFDQEFWSIQGRSMLHVMAMIVKQNDSKSTVEEHKTIRRVSKSDMKSNLDDIMVTEKKFKLREKKPQMPAVDTQAPADSEFEKRTRSARSRAEELDLQYLWDVSREERCPQFAGYNTRLARETGLIPTKKSKIKYMPLLDESAIEPSTVKATMSKTELVCKKAGQEYSVMTADLQLYRISTYILWTCPTDFTQPFLLRLGGMHMLMSYVGCIGQLMSGTGLTEVMNSTFTSVEKMLNGKLYPQNVRALRLVMEEVLQPQIATLTVTEMANLPAHLDELGQKSRTTKVWVENLIKPMFVVMKYVRAEREADWPLHLDAVSSMLDLFFAAGHQNYARFGVYYLQSMKSMPSELRKHFLNGEHVTYLSEGLFNGVWTDQAIESTYMKYGKGKKGIGRTAIRSETQRLWAYSAEATTTMSQSVRSLCGNRDVDPLSKHKEETKSRLDLDETDKANIHKKLSLAIDPLNSDQHPSLGVVNIATGYIDVRADINVDESASVGHKQRADFEKSLPDGFHNPISRLVTTMKPMKKGIRVGSQMVFDTSVIYLRAMVLNEVEGSDEVFDTEKLLTYELAPIPTSMFSDDGSMRATKKSDLKKKLKVEEAEEQEPDHSIEATFLDGCAVLWTIPWPAEVPGAGGRQRQCPVVRDFLQGFLERLVEETKKYDTYLIMDRYRRSSIKEATRRLRAGQVTRPYTLDMDSPLPDRKAVLNSSDNKAQLITLLCQFLRENAHRFCHHRLVVTGPGDYPEELHKGLVIQRRDMKTTHEEADNIIVQQVTSVGAISLVVSDDTDVFVLLCHYVNAGNITENVFMVSTGSVNDDVININATVRTHKEIMPDLLAAHCLSGCDTVAGLFGIGKLTVISTLQAQLTSLQLLYEHRTTEFEDLLGQASNFVMSCYVKNGASKFDTLNDVRHFLWKRKLGRCTTTIPELQSLPPTVEAFTQNVKRCILQLAIWLSALDDSPPNLDPAEYGWYREPGFDSWLPVLVADGVRLAPEELLRLIKCSCASETPCSTKRCSCHKAGMPCTDFCECANCDGHCHNPLRPEMFYSRNDDNSDA